MVHDAAARMVPPVLPPLAVDPVAAPTSAAPTPGRTRRTLPAAPRVVPAHLRPEA